MALATPTLVLTAVLSVLSGRHSRVFMSNDAFPEACLDNPGEGLGAVSSNGAERKQVGEVPPTLSYRQEAGRRSPAHTVLQTGSRWEKSLPHCSASLQHLGSLGNLWTQKLLKFSRGQDFYGDRN